MLVSTLKRRVSFLNGLREKGHSNATLSLRIKSSKCYRYTRTSCGKTRVHSSPVHGQWKLGGYSCVRWTRPKSQRRQTGKYKIRGREWYCVFLQTLGCFLGWLSTHSTFCITCRCQVWTITQFMEFTGGPCPLTPKDTEPLICPSPFPLTPFSPSFRYILFIYFLNNKHLHYMTEDRREEALSAFLSFDFARMEAQLLAR